MKTPEEYFESVLGWLLLFMVALTGRMMAAIIDAKRNARPFWTWDLILEIPIAVSMAFIAHSIVKYYNIHPEIEPGVIAIVAYLGPNFLDYLVVQFKKRYISHERD